VGGVELPPVKFNPRLPLPTERESWRIAATAAAEQFWSRAASAIRTTAALLRGGQTSAHPITRLEG